MSELDTLPLTWSDGPYVGKSMTEIVEDYVVVRGDIAMPYARAQLVNLIEHRIAAAGECLEQIRALHAAWGATPVREVNAQRLWEQFDEILGGEL